MDYSPALHDINTDVLRLAEHFRLPDLKRRAAVFMARGITTQNAMERLTTCDAFDLKDIREKIMAQLTSNKKALAEFTGSAAIAAHPGLMQEILQRVTAVKVEKADEEEEVMPSPKK